MYLQKRLTCHAGSHWRGFSCPQLRFSLGGLLSLSSHRWRVGHARSRGPRRMRISELFLLLLWTVGFGSTFPAAATSQPASPQTAPPLQKGIALFQQRKYAEARQELLRETLRHPSSAQGYFYLGMAEVHLGDLAAGERSLRHALELNPGSPNTLCNLGVLLLEQRKPQEALPFLEKANRLEPTNPSFAPISFEVTSRRD